MNRDDRLFAIIGGTLVTVFAIVFLVLAGGISGDIDTGPVVVVRPLSAPSATQEDEPQTADPALPIAPQSGLVLAVDESSREPAGADVVRAMAAGLSTHPQWAAWLVTEDLLTTLVNAVEAVADGYSPAEELGFVRAAGPFLVREDEGRLVIAAGTYRRFDLAVEVLSSIDAADAVEMVRALEPKIEALRRDMAWSRGTFEERLREGVDHLLDVELPAGPIEVERRTVSYVFASDGYESLSGAQRQLLRMGRENASAVQAKLEEIRRAFGWPEDVVEPEVPILVADAGANLPQNAAGSTAEPEPMLTPFDPRVCGIASPLLADTAIMAGGAPDFEAPMMAAGAQGVPIDPVVEDVANDATAVPQETSGKH
jgi:hypothetical protein